MYIWYKCRTFKEYKNLIFKGGSIRIKKTCFSKENKLIVQRDGGMEERKTESRGREGRSRERDRNILKCNLE